MNRLHGHMFVEQVKSITIPHPNGPTVTKIHTYLIYRINCHIRLGDDEWLNIAPKQTIGRLLVTNITVADQT
jgi:hypothetical protein